MAAAPKGPRPIKPKDSPIFPHAGGTWCAVIGGKQKHFGPWHDYAGALQRHSNYVGAIMVGQKPRTVADTMVTLKLVANRYLTAQHARAESGDIDVRSFRDVKTEVEAFVDFVGPLVTVAHLAPEHFAAYRAELVKNYRAAALKRKVTIVRGMFKWAYENDVIDRPVKFGTGFSTVAKERAGERKRRRQLEFTGPEVRKMIDGAYAPLKAMILLGINCGFGNTDVATLRWDDLDLDDAILDTFRNKTGVIRRATLWPETVEALRAVKALKRKPLDKAHAGLVFINDNGIPYVRDEPRRNAAGQIVGAAVVDNIPQEFGRMMARIGIFEKPERKAGAKWRPQFKSDGRGFYTLRRTHRTWADEVGDRHAADLIMGHAFGSTGGQYVQRVADERLTKVTDHARSKVFGTAAT